MGMSEGKKEKIGGRTSSVICHCRPTHCHPLCPARHHPLRPPIVVVVVAIVLLLVAVVVVAVLLGCGGGCGFSCACGLWLWLPISVCLGDAACHVIYVGTCCPNLHHHLWVGGSVVKCVFIVSVVG